ncbi:MAG: hypothetical protein ACF8QF_06335 [Phycisphaerales bacterium]
MRAGVAQTPIKAFLESCVQGTLAGRWKSQAVARLFGRWLQVSVLGGRTVNERPESFQCSQCAKRYRWTPEIAGRTIRCACGAKVRCPLPADDTATAAESLDDTVADVVLEEAFDQIDAEGAGGADAEAPIQSTGEVIVRRRRGTGIFGLGPAGETLFWGIGFLIGLCFVILAVIVRFWFYIAAAAICTWTAWKFYQSWKNWTRGRPWLECLAEAFGEAEDDKAGV